MNKMLKNEDKISPISQAATVWVELYGIRRCVTLVYIQDTQDDQLIVAASVKHPLDSFSRPEGRKIANARLIRYIFWGYNAPDAPFIRVCAASLMYKKGWKKAIAGLFAMKSCQIEATKRDIGQEFYISHNLPYGC